MMPVGTAGVIPRWYGVEFTGISSSRAGLHDNYTILGESFTFGNHAIFSQRNKEPEAAAPHRFERFAPQKGPVIPVALQIILLTIDSPTKP